MNQRLLTLDNLFIDMWLQNTQWRSTAVTVELKKPPKRHHWQSGEHNNMHVIDEKSINIRVGEEFLELDKFQVHFR